MVRTSVPSAKIALVVAPLDSALEGRTLLPTAAVPVLRVGVQGAARVPSPPRVLGAPVLLLAASFPPPFASRVRLWNLEGRRDG